MNRRRFLQTLLGTAAAAAIPAVAHVPLPAEEQLEIAEVPESWFDTANLRYRATERWSYCWVNPRFQMTVESCWTRLTTDDGRLLFDSRA